MTREWGRKEVDKEARKRGGDGAQNRFPDLLPLTSHGGRERERETWREGREGKVYLLPLPWSLLSKV